MDITFTFTTGFYGDPQGEAARTSFEILPMPADSAYGVILAPFRFWPVPSVVSVSKLKIGYRFGCNISVVDFTFDRPVIEWAVRVNSWSHLDGTEAALTVVPSRGFGQTPFGTWPFGQGDQPSVTAGSAEITDEELLQGENVVAIYGRGLDGEWTPPVRVPA